MAHYSAVIRLDPSRESAWKRLGYKKQGRRWVKPEDLAAEKLEAARQKQADKFWGKTLEKLRVELLSKDAAKRAHAERELDLVTDPRGPDDLGTVRARQRAAANGGGPDAGAHRWTAVLERAGCPGDLQPVGQRAPQGDRDLETSRSCATLSAVSSECCANRSSIRCAR